MVCIGSELALSSRCGRWGRIADPLELQSAIRTDDARWSVRTSQDDEHGIRPVARLEFLRALLRTEAEFQSSTVSIDGVDALEWFVGHIRGIGLDLDLFRLLGAIQLVQTLVNRIAHG